MPQGLAPAQRCSCVSVALAARHCEAPRARRAQSSLPGNSRIDKTTAGALLRSIGKESFHMRGAYLHPLQTSCAWTRSLHRRCIKTSLRATKVVWLSHGNWRSAVLTKFTTELVDRGGSAGPDIARGPLTRLPSQKHSPAPHSPRHLESGHQIRPISFLWHRRRRLSSQRRSRRRFCCAQPAPVDIRI